jgi:hypothetical protein
MDNGTSDRTFCSFTFVLLSHKWNYQTISKGVVNAVEIKKPALSRLFYFWYLLSKHQIS